MTDVNWKTHLRHWSERLEAFSVSLQPLFETVTTEDSNKSLGWFEKQRDLYPDYLIELVPEDLIGLSWWRPNDLPKFFLQISGILEEQPDDGNPDPLPTPRILPYTGLRYDFGSGELDTLEYLWSVRDNEEDVFAVLIRASLFSRLCNSRSAYPKDYWPPRVCVEKFYDQVCDYLREVRPRTMLGRERYHHSCTNVLPVPVWDRDYKIETMNQLVRYLAEEHASLLTSWRPVSIKLREPMKENKFTGWGKKEEALYFAGYPRSEEYYKGDMEFEEFLGLKAKLVGPKDFWAAEEHLGKVDSVTGWKPHFTVSQLKKLVFEPVED